MFVDSEIYLWLMVHICGLSCLGYNYDGKIKKPPY